MTTPVHDPARLDQAMREAHADAVAQVSAATMAQLHRRRHAALSPAPARGLRWRLPAAAFASLLLVAAGLGFGLRTIEQAPDVPAAGQVVVVDGADGLDSVLDDLGQSPDFYAWLASGDAELIAME